MHVVLASMVAFVLARTVACVRVLSRSLGRLSEEPSAYRDPTSRDRGITMLDRNEPFCGAADVLAARSALENSPAVCVLYPWPPHTDRSGGL